MARLALVTGASAGIGLETALGLARAGFRVVMVGRDAARTERARDDVAKRLAAERRDAAPVETALADFASLASVRSLAAAVLSRMTGSTCSSTTPGSSRRDTKDRRTGTS